MIVVKLQGGLGNQMFQFATGFSLALQKKTKLLLDLSFLQANSVSTNTFTARGYELCHFNHSIRFAKKKDLDFFFPRNRKILQRVIRTTKRFLRKPVIVKEQFPSGNSFEDIGTDVYIDGYWQNEDYFKENRKVLLSFFSFPKIASEFKSLEERIHEENSVSIHFRRGDYASKEHIMAHHGLCDISYYNNALGYLLPKVHNMKLFLFSDEPEWVIKNFKTNYEFQIVDTGSCIFDMYLMSLCKHNIIANSSFSWWGAWLNQNSDKVVVAPQKWFANEMKNKNLKIVPEEWIKL